MDIPINKPLHFIKYHSPKKPMSQSNFQKGDRVKFIKGLRKLLELKPDALILEPTGHWYAHFWVSAANKNDIQIYWVGNADLDKQRGSYGFTNKRDEEDALCLAACYFDNRFVDVHNNKRFLPYYYGEAWIEYDESNGKLQKRDRSLRKFQAFMGLAYSYKQSGDKASRKFHGSTLIRSHLYAWAVCMVAPKKNG